MSIIIFRQLDKTLKVTRENWFVTSVIPTGFGYLSPLFRCQELLKQLLSILLWRGGCCQVKMFYPGRLKKLWCTPAWSGVTEIQDSELTKKSMGTGCC